MILAALLDELGGKMRIDGVALDGSGACTLLFDDAYEVTFQQNAEDRAILFSSDVGAFDQHDSAGAMRLLSASLLGAETGGGALAVDREHDRVILWKRFADDFPDLPAFEEALNAFLPQVIAWKERLAASAREEPYSPPESQTFDSFGLRI